MAALTVFALLFTLTAAAQAPHRSFSFLNVQAAYASNALASYGTGLTNLATARAAGDGTTNVTATVYSNLNARVVINSTAGTSNVTASGVNIFKDVPLWALRDGGNPWTPNFTNGNYDLVNRSFANLGVTWTAGSGANAAVTFVVTPLYDGVNEATTAAEEWTFAFTAVASTTSTYATNVPLHRWPGAGKLRIRRITNGDADASSQVIITKLNLNGFVP